MEGVWDGSRHVRSSHRGAAETERNAGSHISCLRVGLPAQLAHGVGMRAALGDMVVLMVLRGGRRSGASTNGLGR
jgi:hypothetical protein